MTRYKTIKISMTCDCCRDAVIDNNDTCARTYEDLRLIMGWRYINKKDVCKACYLAGRHVEERVGK